MKVISAVAVMLVASPVVSALDALFIGNSYTYYSDMPGMLKDIANSTGAELTTEQNTPGGSALWQHASPSSHGATTLNLLENAPDPLGWDFVVLQDQSQTPGGGRVSSGSALPEGEGKRRSMAAIEDTFLPRLGKATPVLYSTWGRRDGDGSNPTLFPDFSTMNELTTAGYVDYANLLPDPIIVPAGKGFEIIWNENSAPVTFRDLYWSNNDGSHPSIQGTYMVACMFYSRLFDASPLDITFRPSRVSQAEAEYLRDVAARALSA